MFDALEEQNEKAMPVPIKHALQVLDRQQTHVKVQVRTIEILWKHAQNERRETWPLHILTLGFRFLFSSCQGRLFSKRKKRELCSCVWGVF